MTYAEYLAMEAKSDVRHEFIDGVIVAMSGGSDAHNAITARILFLTGTRLPRGCRGYSSDQRLWIESTRHGRYADAVIICGAPLHPAHDKQATTNPVVIFEVLSPSTEDDDEGDKLRDYQTLASLEAYVLIAQHARRVKIYRREGGAWTEQLYRSGDRFALPRLTSDVAVDDVYEDVVDVDGRSLLSSYSASS